MMDLIKPLIIDFIAKGVDIYLETNAHMGAMLRDYCAMLHRHIWPA